MRRWSGEAFLRDRPSSTGARGCGRRFANVGGRSEKRLNNIPGARCPSIVLDAWLGGLKGPLHRRQFAPNRLGSIFACGPENQPRNVASPPQSDEEQRSQNLNSTPIPPEDYASRDEVTDQTDLCLIVKVKPLSNQCIVMLLWGFDVNGQHQDGRLGITACRPVEHATSETEFLTGDYDVWAFPYTGPPTNLAEVRVTSNGQSFVNETKGKIGTLKIETINLADEDLVHGAED